MNIGGRIRSWFFSRDNGLEPVEDSSAGRRHRPDYKVALYMSLLMLLGLVIIYAIGPQRANVLNNAYGTDYGETYFFTKQAISLGVALIAFFIAAYVPYRWFTKHAGKILVIGLLASAALAVSGMLGLDIAQASLGAVRWFNLGPLGSFQPSELLKFGLLLFFAVFLGSRAKQNKINDPKETLYPLAIALAASLFLVIVLQKDLGTGISMTAMVATMLFVSGLNKRLILLAIGALIVVGGLFVVSEPHRISRVATFLQGDEIASDDAGSYHIAHAKIAIGTGGLFGVGIGNSVQATGYLPEAINDSVFAIMGETFGFVGLLAILILFFVLMIRMLKIMDHMLDIRLRLIVAGVFGWFSAHVILNIASMIGILPLTGITLPLLSFGGTSMIFVAAALGLVFQLSHYTAHPSRIKEVDNENTSSRRRVGRSRYSSRSYSRGD